jgi:hypothetical protein
VGEKTDPFLCTRPTTLGALGGWSCGSPNVEPLQGTSDPICVLASVALQAAASNRKTARNSAIMVVCTVTVVWTLAMLSSDLLPWCQYAIIRSLNSFPHSHLAGFRGYNRTICENRALEYVVGESRLRPQGLTRPSSVVSAWMAACDQLRIPLILRLTAFHIYGSVPHTLRSRTKVGVSCQVGVCDCSARQVSFVGCTIEGSGIGAGSSGKGVGQTRGCEEGGVGASVLPCCKWNRRPVLLLSDDPLDYPCLPSTFATLPQPTAKCKGVCAKVFDFHPRLTKRT